MTVGSKVSDSDSSLDEVGVNANSVVRVRARTLGGCKMLVQVAILGTYPQCVADKCWPYEVTMLQVWSSQRLWC